MGRLAEKPRYYWDACAWIALIQQEPDRFDSLKYVVEEAKATNVEIWTSTFTLAEVYKRVCDDEQKGLLATQDQNFEDLILQTFVQRVQVDYDVGVLARRLLRAHPTIQKPQDGIHLATALLNNVDELHTFDRENLLVLTERIPRKDGKPLRICGPPKRPKPKPLPLFEPLESTDNESNTKDTAAEGGGRS
jgi:predicted nucleic acid-binding protein